MTSFPEGIQAQGKTHAKHLKPKKTQQVEINFSSLVT